MRLRWFVRRLIREQMGRVLYCSRCGTGVTIVAASLPYKCATCDRVTTWSMEPIAEPAPEPTVKWELGVNDRRFLRSVRIQADEPAEAT